MSRMTGTEMSPAPPVPMTVKVLAELQEHVSSNNEKIRQEIGNLINLTNTLHGDGPPSQDTQEPGASAGALGHVQFSLTEQDRLLAALTDAIARI